MSAREEEAGLAVVRRLHELGHTAYYAGGCVRDQLLGRPANDIDVATNARPEQVQAAFKRTIPMGIQFGIVVVRWKGISIEVATFRADGEYHDGRRPDSVRYTDAQEDASRRDFTVNGLFYDPLEQRVHDFVGGAADLRRGVVRAIGDPAARFEEDKLRVLRAPRFAATLGFVIDPATAEAARQRAPEVAVVAQERIHAELVKLLKKPTRARGIVLCQELGLLEHVLPETQADLPRVLRTLDALAPHAPLTTVWASLLQLAGPKGAEAALRRLRAANKEIKRVVALLEALEQARGLPQLGVAEQKRALVKPEWEELPELLRATALAAGADLESLRYLQQRQRAFLAEQSPASPSARPLIMGADLQAVGIAPGPVFGRVLRQVGDAQLEGRVTTADEALALALSLAQA
jgi:poly(A) polymerase